MRAGFVLAGMECVRYRAGELTLCPGDRLFLYTDGVTEATNENNKLYGEDRLLSFMNDNLAMDSTEFLPTLKKNIDKFVGEEPQFDDITMLLFDFKPIKDGDKMINKVFPAKVEVLSDVLDFVEENLELRQCLAKTKTAICVAIEELFVNIARYAYGSAEGKVTLGIAFEETHTPLSVLVSSRLAEHSRASAQQVVEKPLVLQKLLPEADSHELQVHGVPYLGVKARYLVLAEPLDLALFGRG
jgi:hypothetical protein